MKRDFQIAFLRRAGLESHHRFCDLGCGTLRGGIPVIRYLEEGRYFGCDVRAEAIGEGCLEIAEHGLADKNPTVLLSRNFTDFALSWRFDFIWAFSVLFHLEDDMLDRILGFAARHLAADGVFYANVNTGEKSDGAWREFALVTRELSFYEDRCRLHGLDISDIGPLRELGHRTNVASQDEQRMLKITKSPSCSQ